MYLSQGQTAAILAQSSEAASFFAAYLLCHMLRYLWAGSFVMDDTAMKLDGIREWKDGCIIRWTEHQGGNQSYWLHRSTETVPADGIEGTVGEHG